MVLTDEALEQVTHWGTAMIPWNDVEQIGVAQQYGNKFVGIRLRTYDRYVASLSPDTVEAFTKYLPYTKGLVRATAYLDTPKVVELWSTFRGYDDPKEALKNFGKVGTLVEGLLWVREATGYDVLFAWVDLDRPVEQFVALLEQYRGAPVMQ